MKKSLKQQLITSSLAVTLSSMWHHAVVFAQDAAAEEAASPGIGSLINSLVSSFTSDLRMALTGVAILMVLINSLYGLVMGSDAGSKTKDNYVKIGIYYAVGMSAATIVHFVQSAITGGGYQ
ncbi:MAG: hypothetical protein Q4B80_01820 [Aerococcaceae bacterium]|nr:hypothetical protein [Aerococcaceae bacterium]